MRHLCLKTKVAINDTPVSMSKIAIFEREGEEMIFENFHIKPADIFVFNGEKYAESIVAQDFFAMNQRSGDC